MNDLHWFAVVVAGTASLFAPIVVKPVLLRIGAFDVPNSRSSHTRPTLRGGGLAPLVGWVIGSLVVILGDGSPSAALLATIAFGAAAAASLGFWDDLRNANPFARLGLQLVLGATTSLLLCVQFDVSVWWAVPLGIGIAWYINVANFMDGINGISAAHGLIVGAAFSVLGSTLEVVWLSVAGLLIAVVFAAFMPWNLSPPGMFLGDVGSYLLGGSIAMVATAAALDGVPAVGLLAPLSIYLADTLFTIIRRAFRGEMIFRAHRLHTYQRLTDSGLTHLAVAGMVAGFTAISSALGVLVAIDIIPSAVGVVGMLALAAIYLLLPRLRGQKPATVPNAPLSRVLMPSGSRARPGFAPRRWVVVGATGFIGLAVGIRLREAGETVVDVRAPRLVLAPSVEDGLLVAELSKSDPAIDELSFQFMHADVVINAAGLATPDAGASDELYGANSLLPAVVARAAQAAGVKRVVHLSSAAVQGRRPILDETADASPFSPYSRSKAIGERGLLSIAAEVSSVDTDLLIVRATSVQGAGRQTTESLRRVARSPIASVSRPGTQPSIVSSVMGLVDVVQLVGSHDGQIPPIVLQPWEGLSALDVLRYSGGRTPRLLPEWLCLAFIGTARAVSRVVPEVAGVARRVEVMWFGQAQVDGWAARPVSSERVIAVLKRSEENR